MLTADYDFVLPQELIAQQPLAQRSSSRMLVVHRASGALEHRRTADLPEYLQPADLLVLNNTKVYPARIYGTWADTGGGLELLLVEETEPQVWQCIGGSGRPMRPGLQAVLAEGAIRAEVLARDGENCTVRLETDRPLLEVLAERGHVPLPPYIRRESREAADLVRYQTLYAEHTGAVAAPTAGLHFDEALFGALRAKGVHWDYITLHVGPGTFKPVKAERLQEHTIDPERYQVSAETAQRIVDAKAAGGRVVAVGSTSVRTLETLGLGQHGSGRSSLFIHPPYSFKVVDMMLTNFHLPKSTLLMMVCALAGRELALRAYEEAVRERYRFYSYGDAMLIV